MRTATACLLVGVAGVEMLTLLLLPLAAAAPHWQKDYSTYSQDGSHKGFNYHPYQSPEVQRARDRGFNLVVPQKSFHDYPLPRLSVHTDYKERQPQRNIWGSRSDKERRVMGEKHAGDFRFFRQSPPEDAQQYAPLTQSQYADYKAMQMVEVENAAEAVALATAAEAAEAAAAEAEEDVGVSFGADALSAIIGANWLNPTAEASPGSIGFNPSALTFGMYPSVLSPSASAHLVEGSFNPSALTYGFYPSLLSPSIGMKGLGIDASPNILTGSMSPSVLSPNLQMALAELSASPTALHSEISPCVLSPSLALKLLSIGLSPSFLNSYITPSALCPSMDLQLVNVGSLSPGGLIDYSRTGGIGSPSLSLSLLEV